MEIIQCVLSPDQNAEFMVSYSSTIEHQLAVVRGRWSAIGQLLNINLLWSGVGGQLLVNF